MLASLSFAYYMLSSKNDVRRERNNIYFMNEITGKAIPAITGTRRKNGLSGWRVYELTRCLT